MTLHKEYSMIANRRLRLKILGPFNGSCQFKSGPGHNFNQNQIQEERASGENDAAFVIPLRRRIGLISCHSSDDPPAYISRNFRNARRA